VNAWRRVAASLTLAALAAIPARAAAQPPLTNEDVVRMVAAGTPEGEILEAIRARPEAFDLADDMVDELKLAGVSAAIVAAMGQRHAESAPPAPPPVRPRRGQAPLVVTLNPAGSGQRTLKVPAWADEDARARLHLPKENEQRQVKDLAVFLACAAPEHIPDLWRSKTPLGRDMEFVMRHEMLAFVAGDTPDGKTPRLTLPTRLEAEVDDTDPHDVVLGVAARIGDHWVQLAFAVFRTGAMGAGGRTLSARIERVGHAFDFKIELTAPR